MSGCLGNKGGATSGGGKSDTLLVANRFNGCSGGPAAATVSRGDDDTMEYACAVLD